MTDIPLTDDERAELHCLLRRAVDNHTVNYEDASISFPFGADAARFRELNSRKIREDTPELWRRLKEPLR